MWSPENKATRGSDTFKGTEGNNNAYSLRGQDTLDGGGGNDTLRGGADSDTIKGGDGNDDLRGNRGDDTLNGGDGDDMLKGGDDNDTLNGGRGADKLDGGAGQDWASYAGSDAGVSVSLATGAGAGGHAEGDVLKGIENLIGSRHADTLTGDAGANVLNGGAGKDWASYAGSDAGVTVDLSDKNTDGEVTGFGGHAAGDTLIDIEHLIGSDHNDSLTGDAEDNHLLGGAGDDVLKGLGGQDTLEGGAGNDTLHGHAKGDSLDGGAGTDWLGGAKGNDTLTGGAGADTFIFKVGEGHDVITDFEDGVDEINLNVLPGEESYDDLIITLVDDEGEPIPVDDEGCPLEGTYQDHQINTLITWGDEENSIFLDDIRRKDISADDFVFD